MLLNNKKRNIIFRIILIITIILIAFISIKFFNITRIYKTGAVDEIILEAKTVKGVLSFLILYALRPIFVILPASPMAIAGGVMYGTFLGTLIVVIGALISGTFGFFLARFIGKEYFDRITHGRISKVKAKIEKGSWATIVFLNFVGFPWDFVSIAAGLSKIKYRDFFLGIFISAPPQSFIAVFLGNVLLSVKSFSDISKIEVLIVLVIIILGLTLPHFIKRKIEKGHKK